MIPILFRYSVENSAEGKAARMDSLSIPSLTSNCTHFLMSASSILVLDFNFSVNHWKPDESALSMSAIADAGIFVTTTGDLYRQKTKQITIPILSN